MKKVIFSILFFAIGFSCIAERECNEIPEEYKETKVFKWSKEKHGKEYFEKDNWQWKLKPHTSFMDPLKPCMSSSSPCIVIGDTCVHGNLFNKRNVEERVIVRWHGEGQFVIQFDAIDTNRMYNFLCETADENPKIFFNNLKKKMGNNMKCFHTSGSGDDKVPYYEITFKD